MAGKGKFTVTRESDSGRNLRFRENRTGRELSRPDLVREIKGGKHEDMHVRRVHGVETPCTNPDGREGNNLG